MFDLVFNRLFILHGALAKAKNSLKEDSGNDRERGGKIAET
jgi:hypothetical protein